MILLVAWLLFTGLTSTVSSAADDTFNISKASAISKPGCPSKCGDVSVPFPFGIGIGSGCALDQGFEINCTKAFSPPDPGARALIGSIRIYEISDSRMRISSAVARKCYDRKGAIVQQNSAVSNITGTPFTFSDLNKVTIIGCDDLALLGGQASACATHCSTAEDVTFGKCSGKGCCQVSMARGTQYYNMSVISLSNHTNVSSFNPCGYAFIGERGRYLFQPKDLSDLEPNVVDQVRESVPIVLDWVIGKSSCEQAVKNSGDYACKANSYCIDSDTGLGGYRCSCANGYQGNPYLHPGCIGIMYFITFLFFLPHHFSN